MLETSSSVPTTTTHSTPDAPGAPIVVLHQLVKEFPVTSGAVLQRRVGSVKAVSNVSFAVNRGETFGMVGESGCGKTTIGRLIVALERPTSGDIMIDGVNFSNLRGRKLRSTRKDVQMMFQDPYASLDPRMRVEHIIREPLAIQKMGTKYSQREQAEQLLADVGIGSDAMDKYPYQFSGGQRQRLGLARALALRPKVIVADEPVSALDVSIRSHVLNLMNDLQKKYGLTYVIISHDLSVVKYISDRIGVMYLGKLVELAPSTDIYVRPVHPYTQGLLNAIPFPDPTIERSKVGAIPKGEIPSAISPPSGCRYRTRCARAQDICAKEEPPLRTFGPEHLAACHFPLLPPIQDV